MKRILDRVVLVSIVFAIITISCHKEVTPPVLTTTSPSAITINSVTTGGNITKSGGDDVTARGVCWGTTRNPSVSGSHTTDGKGSGDFDVTLTGLTPNTMYYIRAYATNSAGTGYGNEVSFTTTALTVATLTTTAASTITYSSAVTGGDITGNGGADVTARGVCWSTSANPTVDGDKTSEGTGSGSFSSSLTGLLPSTTYHVRAYATNSVGTAYGSEITFTTNALSAPVLSTTAASQITLTTALSGGNITSDGGAEVTVRGICWAKTENPTTANDKTINGTGTGVFESSMTGLTAGSTYYVRAYATNSIGTAYGDQVTFETSPVTVPSLTTTALSSISYTSAVSGGSITSDGGAAITSKGICWSTTPAPTIVNEKTSNGTGTGSFTSNISALLPGTVYYVRAYATNSFGTGYGDELSFTTTAIGLPAITTNAITNLGISGATSGGTISSDGGGSITAKGVCWSISVNPTTLNDKTSNGTGTASFTSNITGLTPSTTYHVRAYATNSSGTSYGEDVTFTTNAAVAPTLSTTAVSALSYTSATSGGNITSDGGAAVTERGVCWAQTESPTTAGSKTTDGPGSGSFASSITGLLPGTLYHVRAYATNAAGTAYGNDIQFTTTAYSAPTLTTTAISAVTATSASSGGTITSNGGSAITASGICWSTSANPTATDSHTTDGTAAGSFSSQLTGLTTGTIYYVRAYATNSVGTSYGTQVTFGTKLSDIEGNLYGIVQIGSQVWTTENMRTATLNNSTPIPNITNNATWSTMSTMAYSWYNNDIGNKPVYGALYNWFTVETGNLCPTGWHVPSETDFGVLESYLGLSAAEIAVSWDWRGSNQGAMLKSTTGWGAGLNGTNTTGFTGLPGGYRYAVDGTFNNYADLAYFWSSTELDAANAWYRRLDGNESRIFKAAVFKIGGKFVRCVKN